MARTAHDAPSTTAPDTPDIEATIGPRSIAVAFAIALAVVLLTRWPVARKAAYEPDEIEYLVKVREARLPVHHTLFLASARVLGGWSGDPYRGFVILSMLASAGALAATWWWLRAVVRPATALAATAMLAAGPLFWSYGGLAGNYTAIILVGSMLLGLVVRSWDGPRPAYPIVAAVVLALGTGYRQDIGMFWLPVFGVLLLGYRWKAAARALAVFTIVNLCWLVPMLVEAGGWARYRAATSEFAYQCGYLNSIWNLGFVDAPVRYSVKLVMALAWTFGPALLLAAPGFRRMIRGDRGMATASLLVLSMLPALGLHLLIHFGVAGYAFHDVPALLAMIAIGAEGCFGTTRAPARLAGMAAVLAVVFLAYPTLVRHPRPPRPVRPGFRPPPRVGLATRPPEGGVSRWRTANSRALAGRGGVPGPATD